MHYCYQEKTTGAVLFLGEGNRCTTVIRRRELVLYCFQEKGSDALLFSGDGNRCCTVFRRKKQDS